MSAQYLNLEVVEEIRPRKQYTVKYDVQGIKILSVYTVRKEFHTCILSSTATVATVVCYHVWAGHNIRASNLITNDRCIIKSRMIRITGISEAMKQ